ncbi:hypothetical protein FGO68_gene7112 [Halteria grandinella]|uniref:Uncharacterized protein n=1 Tax=Halteria grandinella TaxID=5974 RepID=A0A8J8NL41_HALGN|nr:hypothetical protein FGO68_gene7112 [Halteria grandinella]
MSPNNQAANQSEESKDTKFAKLDESENLFCDQMLSFSNDRAYIKRYQRQEIYQFLSVQTLFCKIAKLSKRERGFAQQLAHQWSLRLIVTPPKLLSAPPPSDFLLSFSPTYTLRMCGQPFEGTAISNRSIHSSLFELCCLGWKALPKCIILYEMWFKKKQVDHLIFEGVNFEELPEGTLVEEITKVELWNCKNHSMVNYSSKENTIVIK